MPPTRRTLTLALVLTTLPLGAGAQAFRRAPAQAGFATNTLAANDDESTDLVNIGFPVYFAGQTRTQLYVNNNGNVTFEGPLVQYTPSSLTDNTGLPIIAAYFADVDTRGARSALTRYGSGTVDGRAAFGVNYDGVGYYSSYDDKLNIFQLILIDRHDVAAGDFDIEFDYDRMLWETGDASDGVNGFGGTSAAVGYSNGTGVPGSFAQLAGSFVNGALIDGGANALVSHSQGSNVLGRYLFQVRGGAVTAAPPVVTAAPEPATLALFGGGLSVLGVAARRRRGLAA